MPIPEQLGPSALPSNFSPQCPVGETYTLPPMPLASATPDPAFPPPPITPAEARYQHALPLEIRQSRFCTGAETASWYLDTAGVLSYAEAGGTPSRRQLTPAQIGELMSLLDANQPHQQTFASNPVYRCQAAEVCPLVNDVQVGTGHGGRTGWSERGNLVYPASYTRTMDELLAKLTAFGQAAPSASQHTYLAEFSVVLFDAAGQPIGTRYRLLRDGRLNGFLPPGTDAESAAKIGRTVTSAELNTFRSLLQRLDPVSAYQAAVPDADTGAELAGQTLWHFELESATGSQGMTIYSGKLPATDAGRALSASLAELERHLAALLEVPD